MDQKIAAAIQSYSLEWNFFVFKTFANLHLAFATKLEKKPNKEDQKLEKSKPAVEPREDVNPVIEEQNLVDYDNGKIVSVRTHNCKFPKKYFQAYEGFVLFLGHNFVELFLVVVINLDGDVHSELLVVTKLNWKDDPGGGCCEYFDIR